MPENTYWDRTDSFEEKMRLLNDAWAKKDYRLARALAHSLRVTIGQAQQEEEAPPAALSAPARDTAELPQAWREWARPWRRYVAIALDESIGTARPPEPIEVTLAAPAAECASLAREARVAVIENGAPREIPCQVTQEVRRGATRSANVLFLLGGGPHERRTVLLFYGNPDAELPRYPSDLETRGEGFALQIENDFYRATLSRQMGQLERLTMKREHGLELFAGGEGHGEPPGIDWAHDYVTAGNLQKMRITLWDTCPDYEVIRGPLFTSIRRWGFPYSPIHPVFSPARVHVDVEYRFYAGLPWFHKAGTMRGTKAVEVEALRDDEWVFSGQSFTEALWMGPDGKIRTGDVDPALKEKLWAVGFANPTSRDCFVALYLDHRAEGLPEPRHAPALLPFYRWHGHVWSRYPLPGKSLPAGAVLHQKNAYTMIPYDAGEGPRLLEQMRQRLVNPYAVSAYAGNFGGATAPRGRLARPGEAGDTAVPKAVLWEALRACKDEQLYQSDLNVVDLGLIYDLRMDGGTVTVVLAMPHRGRPLGGYFTYGSGGNSNPIRTQLLRVPGVRKVVVEQTWEPGWNSNRLTDAARQKFGMPAGG